MVGPYFHTGAKKKPDDFVVDHIYPVGSGGSNDILNGQLISLEAHKIKTSFEKDIDPEKDEKRAQNFRKNVITAVQKGKGIWIKKDIYIIDIKYERDAKIKYPCKKGRELEEGFHFNCKFK